MEPKPAFAAIRAIQHKLLRHVAEAYLYPWDAEFSVAERERVFYAPFDAEVRVDFRGLTLQECEDLGFGRYQKETHLRLIPLYLYPFMAFDQTLLDLNYKTMPVKPGYWRRGHKNYIDTDHRAGMLAFGFYPIDASNIHRNTDVTDGGARTMSASQIEGYNNPQSMLKKDKTPP